jgi:uncharacterized protein (DUF885 family)
MTLAEAADYLVQRGPMDVRTAKVEASAFSAQPGQAISYQTGKLQIEKLLAETRLRQGQAFSLRRFDDALCLNGNVPLVLQRWESLGADDEMRLLDAARAQ